MSQKVEAIQDIVRQARKLSDSYRELIFRRDQYQDQTWTVSGADEITQEDINDAGYEFTPGELKAVVDTTVEALTLFMNNDDPTVSDYDKKINLIL